MRKLKALLGSAAVAPLLIATASARIVGDGTTGPAGALAGPNFTIDATQGLAAGPNLFHSFRVFNLGARESATFTDTTGGGFQNVIARVTGATPSFINGLLRVDAETLPDANFFFINPNGITFGENSVVDVPAGFHLSTADELRFADGDVMKSGRGTGSTFSLAAPEAFGFLGADAAAISMRVSEISLNGDFSVVGGDISIKGQRSPDSDLLIGSQGTMQLAAVKGPGVVLLDPARAPTVVDFADVSLSDVTLIGQAAIAVQGNNIALNQSFVGSLVAEEPTGQLAIRAAGDLIVDGGGVFTEFYSETGEDGRSADIWLEGARVELNDGFVQSDGGSITVRGADLTLDGATIAQYTSGTWDSGAVDIEAGAVRLLNGSRVAAVAIFNGGGNGPINIHGFDELTISASTVETFNTGSEAGGDISLSSDGLLSLNASTISAQSPTAEHGGPGAIALSARQISLAGESSISSSTTGEGDSGDIAVEALEDLTVDGSWIWSESLSDPLAISGVIRLHADDVGIQNGSVIQTSAYGPGLNGGIVIDAGNQLLVENSRIAAWTQGDTAGKAGGIDLAGGNMRLTDSDVSSTTYGTADAGDVRLEVGELSVEHSRITNQSHGQGDGGDILIGGQEFRTTHSTISNNTLSYGNAGDINLDFDVMSVDGISWVESSASATGNAGDIMISVGSSARITGSTIRTISRSNDSDAGEEGSITIVGESDATIMISSLGGWELDQVLSGSRFFRGISLEESGIYVGANGGNDTRTPGDITIRGFDKIDVYAGALGSNVVGVLPIQQPNADAGLITMSANNLRFTYAQILSFSTGDEVTNGDAGSIRLFASEEILVERSHFDLGSRSGSSAAGSVLFEGDGDTTLSFNASTISVSSRVGSQENARSSITIHKFSTASFLGANLETFAEGNSTGGDVSITANKIYLKESNINTETFGDSSAGLISIIGNVIELYDSNVVSNTRGLGDAGSITIGGLGEGAGPTEAIALVNTLISSSTDGIGDAGAIRLEAAASISLSGSLPGWGYSRVASTSTMEGEDAGAAGTIVFMGDGDTRLDVTRSQISAAIDGGSVETVPASVFLDDFSVVNLSEGRIITITDGNANGGNINIASDNVNIIDSTLLSDAADYSMGNAGSISIEASVLKVRKSDIGSDARSAGNAGSIFLGMNAGAATAYSVEIVGSLVSSTSTIGTGDAGSIGIGASKSIDIINSTVRTEALALNGDGASAGSLMLLGAGTTNLDMRDSSLSAVTASGSALDDPGVISIDGFSRAMLTRSRVTTSTFGGADAGLVSVRADEIRMDDATIESAAADDRFLVRERGVSGSAGEVRITANLLDVANSSSITTSTQGSGDAGVVTLNIADTLSLDGLGTGISSEALAGSTGNAKAVNISAPVISADNGARISSESLGLGNAGEIKLTDVIDLSVLNGAAITSSTAGVGSAGSVTVFADNTTLIDGSIESAALAGSTGVAGRVELTGRTLNLSQGSRIATSTAGSGDAGTVTIDLTESLSLFGRDTEISSAALAGSSGNAKAVTISAPTIAIDNSLADHAAFIAAPDSVRLARITSEALGSGNAGDITLNEVVDLSLLNGGAITTSSAAGAGGDITINFAGSVLNIANDGRIATEVLSGDGRGGDISINGPSLVLLDDADILTRAQGGDGGLINIDAGVIISRYGLLDIRTDGIERYGDPISFIDPSSAAGVSGSVALGGLEGDVTAGVEELSEDFLNASDALARRCAATRAAGAPSAIVEAPAKAGGPRPSDIVPALYGEAEASARPALAAWSPKTACMAAAGR